MRVLLSLVAFLVLLAETTHASARIGGARLASGPSITCVYDANNRARTKSASPTKKSYVGERTHVGPWLSGKEEDIEVGLTYFGARYYAPHLGRWASADPLTVHGLGADLNPYAYVGGRVMSHVDPFGLSDMPATGGEYMTDPTDTAQICVPLIVRAVLRAAAEHNARRPGAIRSIGFTEFELTFPGASPLEVARALAASLR